MTQEKAAAKKAAVKRVAKKVAEGEIVNGAAARKLAAEAIARAAEQNAAATDGQIIISRIETETLRIPLIGTSPLMTHKFSEKAKKQMLDAMQGRKAPKQPKDPDREYRDAAYHLDDGGYGIPAIAFKSATVSAARFFGKSVTMVGLRQTIFVAGEFSRTEGMQLIRIKGEPEMREDVVRVNNGGTDLRYRPCWYEWEVDIDVTYVKSMLTRDSVLSLVEAGGLGVGVGEWRVEKRGDSGTYMINPDAVLRVIS